MADRDDALREAERALAPFAAMAPAFPRLPAGVRSVVPQLDEDSIYEVVKHGTEAAITVGDLRRATRALAAVRAALAAPSPECVARAFATDAGAALLARLRAAEERAELARAATEAHDAWRETFTDKWRAADRTALEVNRAAFDEWTVADGAWRDALAAWRAAGGGR